MGGDGQYTNQFVEWIGLCRGGGGGVGGGGGGGEFQGLTTKIGKICV